MNEHVRDLVIARSGVALVALFSLFVACSRERPEGTQDTAPESLSRDMEAESEIGTLESGDEIEIEIAHGGSRSFRVVANADDFIYIEVDQQKIDVIASIFGPDGEVLVRSDRAIDDVGPEPLLALAKLDGDYRLEIEAPTADGAPGKCVVRLKELHPASDRDRRRAEAARLFFQARIRDNPHEAIKMYLLARSAWQELGDPFWDAECAQRLGREHFDLREWEVAADFQEQAADLYREIGDTRSEAIALTHQGLAYRNLWDIERAIQSYRRVLPLRRVAGDGRGEALTMINLAQAFQHQDEVQDALDYYTRGLEKLSPNNRKLRAIATHNLGVLHLALGQMKDAQERLKDAEQAFAELKSPRRAASLIKLGELHKILGEFDVAFDYLQQSLAIHLQRNDKRGEAIALGDVARVYLARGDPDSALEITKRALEILDELRDPRVEANLLRTLGSIYLEKNQPMAAERHSRQAFDLYKQLGDPTGKAESLMDVATALRQQGNLAVALEASTEALDIFETVRPKAVRHEQRASFFSTVQEHFESHIDLLMTLHQSNSTSGFAAQALVTSERARSRSLLDLLAEAEAGVRADAAPDLVEQERALQRMLNAQESRLFGLRSDPSAALKEITEAKATVDRGLDALETLWGEIRRRSPRYAALSDSRIPTLSEIQREILDEETILLEYRLGRERSFLWLVSRDALRSYVLPGRQQIEQLARVAYERLQRSHRTEARTSARHTMCQLAEQILQPVTRQLVAKRLVIVSDGTLMYIPFAALPDFGPAEECFEAPPLVAGHEIIHLPSISALSALRRDLQSRPAPPYKVAVIADPVFDISDDRFKKPATAKASATTSEEGAVKSRSGIPESFPRLHYSEREAMAILDLVPVEQSFSALGFDASKETVTSGRLANYRIVHFATHGILDAESPNLSKIVLSQIDRSGRRRDGFLSTHEIYNLWLPSDLVVLSACQTALGKEVRGEGLVGLTRGFMYAGAKRVMVSLWKVDDERTSVLMEHFYRGLFEQGLRPPAALRQAQISMLHEAESAAPFHWAGFVIQGDWR